MGVSKNINNNIFIKIGLFSKFWKFTKNNFTKILIFFLNITKYQKKYKKISKIIKKYQKLSKNIKNYQKLSINIKKYQKISNMKYGFP
jgi:cell fate (sporulation/competence/biofilm development) regulator YmcA (YheA/YmcA/DUF963 family)